MICGGIDIGGTKIEAHLFGGQDALPVSHRRITTPKEDFNAFIQAVTDLYLWLLGESGQSSVPVGVAIPGIIDPKTGYGFASNIPITGKPIVQALQETCGQKIPVINDSMAWTYSEAHGGAGDRAQVLMGLVLGTGVGGGLCLNGEIPPRHGGLGFEIGHTGVSGRLLTKYGLPLFPCGCGRQGCYDVYLSGTGMSNLAQWHVGERFSPAEIAASDDPALRTVFEIWTAVAVECLDTIQLTIDPDCIVLGGGPSKIPGIADTLAREFTTYRLGASKQPRILTAKYSESSGARGAALIARST